jgi:hypothetical protein
MGMAVAEADILEEAEDMEEEEDVGKGRVVTEINRNRNRSNHKSKLNNHSKWDK